MKLYRLCLASAAALLTVTALSCDRDRSNPLDPQSDLLRDLPSTPAGLAAQAGVGVVRLSWQAVDSRDLAGYSVYRSAQSNGEYAFVSGEGDSTDQITTGKTSFVDSLSLYGQTFYYRVAAVDTAGRRSERSGFVGATVLADELAPGAPQSLSAVADEGELGQVTLRWGAPLRDANGGELSGLEGFIVFRVESGTGGGAPVDTVAAGVREYLDAGLKTRTSYIYSVVAFDGAGNQSQQAAAVQVTTPGLATPSGLSAAGGIGRIAVTWGAVTDEELIGYNVFRSSRSDGGYEQLAGLEGSAFTTGRTTYIDSSLSGGQLFFYKVQAVAQGALVSELSAFVSAEASADEMPPEAPRNLSAVPDAADFGRVVLSWNAPLKDANGDELTGLSGYAVFRSEETTDSFVRVVQTAASEYTDTGLEESKTYWYTVAAVDGVGNESGRATAVRVRTQGEDRTAPDAPQSVSAVADESTVGLIVVRWSAPSQDADGGELTGLDGFIVMRSEGGPGSYVPVDTVAAATREYVDSGLKSLTTYSYTVVAFDATGNTSRQASASQTQTGGVAVPAALTAAGGIGRITVSWSAVDDSDLQGYTVYRSTRSDGGYGALPSRDGSAFTTGRTTYVDSGLAGGEVYYYRVQALGAGDLVSELSAFVSAEASADESAPGAPQSVSAAADETDPSLVTVRWAAPVTDASGGQLTGLSGFRILRSEGSTGAFLPLAELGPDVRQYNDTGLKSLTVYSYTLVAFDGAGNESAQAAPGRTTTQGVAVPVGLSATDGVGRISLSWQAVGDGDLLGYNVYRASSSGAAFTVLSGEGSGYTTGKTAFVDSNLAAGQLRFYRVTAVTASFESEPSSFVSGTSQADEIPPATPSNLVAISADGSAGISLSWSGSTADSDGGDLSGLSGYIIYRGEGSASALAALDTVGSSSTAYDDAGLATATTYYYAVSAVDVSGNVSTRSTSVSATTRGIGVPVSVAATAGIRRITVAWSASDDDGLRGYNVYRSSRSDQGYTRLTGVEGTSFTTGQTTFIDSNLSGGQILFYRISVVTADGESDQSAFAGATVESDHRAPAAPTFVIGEPVVSDPERLSITWKAPVTDSNGSELTGVSSYVIYRSATSTGSYTQIGTSSSASYEDSGLEARTTYYYQVEALDPDGNISPRSSTAAITTGGVDVPTNVTLVSSTPSDGAEPPIVTISWTASSGAILRYEVQRTTVANSTDDADYSDILPTSLTTSRQDNTGTRGVTYYYRVRAVDGDLRTSDWTTPVGVAVAN